MSKMLAKSMRAQKLCRLADSRLHKTATDASARNVYIVNLGRIDSTHDWVCVYVLFES